MLMTRHLFAGAPLDEPLDGLVRRLIAALDRIAAQCHNLDSHISVETLSAPTEESEARARSKP